MQFASVENCEAEWRMFGGLCGSSAEGEVHVMELLVLVTSSCCLRGMPDGLKMSE